MNSRNPKALTAINKSTKDVYEALIKLTSQELFQLIKILPEEKLDSLASMAEIELIERDTDYLAEMDSLSESFNDRGPLDLDTTNDQTEC
jgi:hypothetical protein